MTENDVNCYPGFTSIAVCGVPFGSSGLVSLSSFPLYKDLESCFMYKHVSVSGTAGVSSLCNSRPLLPVNSHILEAGEDVVELYALSCNAFHFFHRRVRPI